MQNVKRSFLGLFLSICLLLGMIPQILVAEAAKEVVKVACVGDSLTDGYLSSGGNKSDTAYPAYLQGLLGDGYEVRNFGKSSMTMMKNTDKSYWNTTEYSQSISFEPNIVIIMLGTNDSKPVYWNETIFRQDAIALMEKYEELESNPRVVFALSPQCYQTSGTGITRDGVAVMVDAQKKLVAERGWEAVDMYEKTADRQDIYHQDGVHFTDGGYYFIAECMYEVITGQKAPNESDSSRDLPLNDLSATAGSSYANQGPENTLDENASTLWHTDWYGNSYDKLWIQFDVKGTYRVDGLRYQPRQSGNNGKIKSYEILTSNDGVTFTSVAEGRWNTDGMWKRVSFEPTDAKYIRLVAKEISSDSGYIFASAAELRLTGEKKPEVISTEEPTPEVTEAPKPSVTEEPTVEPTETTEPITKVFTDVYDDWYTDYVQYVYDNGLMTGIKGTTQFQPNANITKAQVAQVLYNMANQPAVENQKVFIELNDVYDAEWYADAVAWAYAIGVVTGDLNTKKFNPNTDVTREQLALMMFRCAKYKGYDVTATSDYTGLVNADKVNNWAAEGMNWAVGAGLISGVEKGDVKDLDPQGNASRAQMAAILQRFCENVK